MAICMVVARSPDLPDDVIDRSYRSTLTRSTHERRHGDRCAGSTRCRCAGVGLFGVRWLPPVPSERRQTPPVGMHSKTPKPASRIGSRSCRRPDRGSSGSGGTAKASGSRSRSDASDVVLTAAEPATDIDAELVFGGAVAGTVTGPTGTPAANIRVRLYLAADRYVGTYTTTTAADGTYRIDGVAADTPLRLLYAALNRIRACAGVRSTTPPDTERPMSSTWQLERPSSATAQLTARQ